MRLFYFLLVIVSSACGENVKKEAVPQPTYKHINAYLFEISGEQNVAFSGYVNFDEFQKNHPVNGPMYSGYSAASFLASVLAHAAISKSVDSAQMQKFVSNSNEQALRDIEHIISTYQKSELIESLGTTSLITPPLSTPIVFELNDFQIPKGHIFSQPEFIVTKEQDMVILENIFTIMPVKHPEKKQKRSSSNTRSKAPTPLFSKTIVYLSDKIETPDTFFTVDEGKNLRDLTSRLFLDSVTLFDSQYSKKNKTQGKTETIKFSIGDHFRVERGRVIKRSCDRVTFITLRGWIKSVPQDDCTADVGSTEA